MYAIILISTGMYACPAQLVESIYNWSCSRNVWRTQRIRKSEPLIFCCRFLLFTAAERRFGYAIIRRNFATRIGGHRDDWHVRQLHYMPEGSCPRSPAGVNTDTWLEQKAAREVITVFSQGDRFLHLPMWFAFLYSDIQTQCRNVFYNSFVYTQLHPLFNSSRSILHLLWCYTADGASSKRTYLIAIYSRRSLVISSSSLCYSQFFCLSRAIYLPSSWAKYHKQKPHP